MGKKGKGAKGGKGEKNTPSASDQRQDNGSQQSQERPQAQAQRQHQTQGFQARPEEQSRPQHQPQDFHERPQQRSWPQGSQERPQQEKWPQHQTQGPQEKSQQQMWPKEQRAPSQEQNQQQKWSQRESQGSQGHQKQRWPQHQAQGTQERPQQQRWPQHQAQGTKERPQQQRWPQHQARGPPEERPQQQRWPQRQEQRTQELQHQKWPKEQRGPPQKYHQQNWPQQEKQLDKQPRNLQPGDAASKSGGFRTRGHQFPGSAAGVGDTEATQMAQKDGQSPPSKSADDQGQLVPMVSQMKLTSTTDLESGGEMEMVIPSRNKTGTRGRKIVIEVNHLLLSLKNTTTAIHYDCAFEPEKISKKVARFVINRIREKHFSSRYPAFDGKKNLYSSGKQPLFSGGELSDVIELPQEGKQSGPGGKKDAFEVKVTIKQAGDLVDMSQVTRFMKEGGEMPQDAIQVLDIVLRNPSAMKCTSVGRSFFSPPDPRNRHYLGSGYELWYGFYQSAILGWEPFLNVDVAHKGFPEAKKVELVMLDIMGDKVRRGCPKPTLEDLKTKGLGRYETEDFEKMIRNLRIEYEMPGVSWRRKYTVIGVVQPSNRQTFELENGRMITVEEYFRKEKGIVLKLPNLPCLHVGDPKKTNYLPPELCTVVEGQVVMKKLDKIQTSEMIKAAATVPRVRKEKILKSASHVGFNNDPCIKEFGVSVADNFQEVPARILDPPTLEYGRKRKVYVRNGEWHAQEFISAQPLDRWVVISLSAYVGQNEIRTCVDEMMTEGKNLGMEVKQPMRVDVLCEQPNWPKFLTVTSLNPLLQDYFRGYKKADVQLAVVFLPERPDKVYDRVKVVAELDVGLLTQCIRERTRVYDRSTIRNILLKINCKLNGQNHTVIGNNCRPSVRELLDGAMLMGADVTHPSPDQTKIPSVAAVTASYDKLAFLYNMDWRLQPPKKEIIGDMRAIVRNKIKFYQEMNGVPPKRIIFFRDGVSEGQFNQVLYNELADIKGGCLEVLNYPLPLTFLVVQKRHHTRMFPTSPDHADRKGNVLPGTVVDTVITHPTHVDFYMVSHASLQGTSRPTKYRKLWDENEIDEDDLQELTFYLCHMFSRCTRSVSYPAPTYYAHLAAARGRTYLEGANVDLDKLNQEMAKRTLQATLVDVSPMFFT